MSYLGGAQELLRPHSKEAKKKLIAIAAVILLIFFATVI
jgi:hypothetical protein